MDAENGPTDESSKWQIIECIIKIFPRCRTSIFFNNLIIEPIDSSNLPRLVVPPE